jgi:hypothetical protein
MSNPFVIIETGVFASIAALESTPPMAALICATLAHRIATPPAGTPVLDKGWWSKVFNSIPLLNAATSVSGSIADAKPDNLASLCLGYGVVRDVPTAQQALARWIGAIAPQQISLNAIAVTGSASLINLSLAFLDIGTSAFVRTDATINSGTSANSKSLQSLFGSASPLTCEPYFCNLQGSS